MQHLQYQNPFNHSRQEECYVKYLVSIFFHFWLQTLSLNQSVITLCAVTQLIRELLHCFCTVCKYVAARTLHLLHSSQWSLTIDTHWGKLEEAPHYLVELSKFLHTIYVSYIIPYIFNALCDTQPGNSQLNMMKSWEIAWKEHKHLYCTRANSCVDKPGCSQNVEPEDSNILQL